MIALNLKKSDMKRDIKFKGKRYDNNQWVEGYFYEESGSTYIIDDRQKKSILNRNTPHKVDPTTVCQFTGLKDNDGKMIWEGDIVEREIYDLYKGVAMVKSTIEYKNGSFVANTDGIDYPLCGTYIKVLGSKFDKEENK